MNSLTVAKMVAAHPRVIALRNAQIAMWRRLRVSYGDDFMTPGKSRNPGIHYWTPRECADWCALEKRLNNLRAALRNVYSSH